MPKINPRYLATKASSQNMNCSQKPEAVAGIFYPKQRKELELLIKNYFKEVKINLENFSKPKIIIVPHAGYIYSGKIAAHAYALIKKFKYQNFILLGPSHFYPIDFPITCNFSWWKTPLGKAKVALNLNETLELKILNEAFQSEHSLEVQLPFLKICFSQFSFFPILINHFDKNLAKKLKTLVEKGSLLIISSDLSHYLTQEEAEKVDKKTIEIILSKKINNLEKIDACGQGGIGVAMEIAKELNLKGKLLAYDTSFSASLNNLSVVGYCSLVFSSL